MERVEEFVDERQRAWCIHCSTHLQDLQGTDDHVPSRCLLLMPHPPGLPVVRICKSCNAGFAPDEEYLAAFLGAVVSGSTDPDRQVAPTAAAILRGNARLRREIDGARRDYVMLGGAIRQIWTPVQERVDRVVIKNARGHAFFEQDLVDGWVVVQEGVYRYAVSRGEDGLSVRIVISEYLATEVVWSD